jgi:hypothetical protein
MTPIFGSGIAKRQQTRFVIDTLGVSSLVAPTWATMMDVVCWGGGGAGEGGTSMATGGTGGSRAAKASVPVTGGAALAVFVGAGAPGDSNPSVQAEASYVEISAGNRLTAAGGANHPPYTGAASGGTGVFATPTIAAGAGGATAVFASILDDPGTAGDNSQDVWSGARGGQGGNPDGGAGGNILTDPDGRPTGLTPAVRPGGAGATGPYYETLGGLPANMGGNGLPGASGRVIVQFYP